MKTRGLIPTLAVVFILSSASGRAQSQVTLTVTNGEYHLIAGCRLHAIQTSPSWIGGQPPQPEMVQFASATQTFNISTWIFGAWEPQDPTFGPGEGGIFGGEDATLVFQERLPTRLPLPLASGFALVCCQSNITAGYEDIMGTPPANGTMLYQFNAGPGRNPFNLAAPDYTIFTFANGAWSPTNPVVGITEAVFVYQPPQLSNAQVTANGISFEIAPPLNQQFVIEYTDSLTQPSWQPLTNIVGSGASIKITDNSTGTSVRQRFYRARSSN